MSMACEPPSVRFTLHLPRLAQDPAQPGRDAVVGEHDLCGAGDGASVELEPRHAPAHALGILHHDVVARGAMTERDGEPRPRPWDARIDQQPAAADAKPQQRLETGAI